MINKKRAAGIVGLSFLATLAGGLPAHSAEPQTIKVGILRAGGTLALQHAIETGALAKQGITAEVTVLNNGPAITSALMSGAIDVGFAATMVAITAKAGAQPIRMFVPALIETADEPSSWIDAPSGGPIKSIKDLEGKTLAINAVGGQCELQLLGQMSAAGMTKGSIKTLVVPFPQMPATLQLKNADAACVVEPFHSILGANPQIKSRPIVNGTVPGLTTGQRIVVDGFFSREDWLGANKELAGRFAKSMVASNKILTADRALLVAYFEKYLKIDPKVAPHIELPLETETASMVEADVAITLDAMKKNGLLQTDLAPSDVIFKVN